MNFKTIDQFANSLVDEIHSIPGHLTDRESKHLALLAILSPKDGEILEIGSFLGKSTILLSKALTRFSGKTKVVAVDPLTQPSETDPVLKDNQPSRDLFYKNLKHAGVEKAVEFNEMLSTELATSWKKPIRMLWIDGDHTTKGVMNDFDCFAPHLVPGGIIALHDVMHDFRGPVQVLINKILRTNDFNAAGIVGSIGWAQKGIPSETQKFQNEMLADKLQAWLDAFPPKTNPKGIRKFWLKYKRSRVPHKALPAEELHSILN